MGLEQQEGHRVKEIDVKTRATISVHSCKAVLSYQKYPY